MLSRKVVGYGCVALLVGYVWFSTLVRSEITMAQSFPQQAGFPRFEPRNTITFGSPTVVDIDGDGELDIIVPDGNGCVWAWDQTGHVLPNYPLETGGSNCQGSPRISGPVAVGDVDGDGRLEIAAGTRGTGDNAGERGRTFLWNHDGSLVPGWPQEMAWNTQYGSGLPEVITVAMANLIGDSRLEIAAGTSNNSSAGGTPDDPTHNVYAYQNNGTVLAGFPTQYRRAGIWGFIALADLNNNGYAEILTGRDHAFIHAYNPQGNALSHWPVASLVNPAQPDGLYLEFTRDAPSIGDLDNDGTLEIVIAGKVRDPDQNRAVTNSAVLVLRPDGQRAPGWNVAKLAGAPIFDEYHPTQAPALGDLNGDGTLEIVVTLMDGTIRAYRADGSLLWQYNFAQGHRLFASEAVIGDVSGDGQVDILFGTYSPDGSDDNLARLHGLNASGQPLAGFPLPLTDEDGAAKKGLRAAPTIADLDGDCDVEILAGTQAGVLYVWDLAATYHSYLMPWPTARHDVQRTGFFNTPANPLYNQEQPLFNLFPGNNLYLPLMMSDSNAAC